MKKIMLILGIVLCLTGCNREIIDLNYSYDKAVCNIGGKYQEIEIKSWKDYEGEQIQLKDKNGKTYLVNSMNCTLIDE